MSILVLNINSTMLKIIQQSTTGVKQTFGRFSGLVKPGLVIYIPIVQRVTPVSNRLQQDTFKFEVKTKDNVFALLNLAVQYQVREEDTERAFFSLYKPLDQINSYIENDVRSFSSQKNIDALFESQDEICKTVSENLSKKMKEHGYTIINTLVTGIEPNKEVKDSMNKINSSERLKIAAKNDADAHYIKEVRQAEADKERKRLQGEGISAQRQAILEGYEEGLEKMAKKLGLEPKDVITFVKDIQHLDVMEGIGRSPNTKVLFLNHDIDRLGKQMIQADMAVATTKTKEDI